MGRCVLVTGGSGGIGASMARAFAENGDMVAIGCHTNRDQAERVCMEIRQNGGAAVVVQGDVAQAGQVEEMFAAAEAAFGPVEVLVNNAGFAQQKLFCDITEEEWDHMFAVHVNGAFLCCRRALPYMLGQHRGHILNIASVWGQVGASCESHYAAAKAALIGLTRSLAKEEGPAGVRVNCIAPGAIDTPMMAAFSEDEKAALCGDIPLGRLGKPDEVAALAVFLTSDVAGYITGQVLAPNGGYVV